MNDVLLKVSNLTKWFPIRRGIALGSKGHIRAVDDVSFDTVRGETLGIVGESGCGKSTLARAVLRLIEPTSGSIEYNGVDFTKADRKTLLSMRKHMQIVFQDPYGSLHPKMRVRSILEEPLIIGGYGTRESRRERVRNLISLVGLKEEHLSRFPHEFSGGQRQRIVIARALAMNPELIICDEPVSALDVSVRSQILNLLMDLQNEFGLTYLFISHDLGVVEHICDRVIVMYLGRIVEKASRRDMFDNPAHPYTKALLSSVPAIGESGEGKRIILEGDVPSPANPPSGCHFRTRCPCARDICEEKPEMKNLGGGHTASCHFL